MTGAQQKNGSVFFFAFCSVIYFCYFKNFLIFLYFSLFNFYFIFVFYFDTVKGRIEYILPYFSIMYFIKIEIKRQFKNDIFCP